MGECHDPMVNYTTLVIGASLKPERYSYRAVQMLNELGIEVVAMGRDAGQIGSVTITKPFTVINSIHTVTLYLAPERQQEYFDFIINLKPQRVIFNPGTENPIFAALLTDVGIGWEQSCTLVLLSTDQYQT